MSCYCCFWPACQGRRLLAATGGGRWWLMPLVRLIPCLRPFAFPATCESFAAASALQTLAGRLRCEIGKKSKQELVALPLFAILQFPHPARRNMLGLGRRVRPRAPKRVTHLCCDTPRRHWLGGSSQRPTHTQKHTSTAAGALMVNIARKATAVRTDLQTDGLLTRASLCRCNYTYIRTFMDTNIYIYIYIRKAGR